MFVCTLPVVRKMCDAKVIFSVLSSPNVRNQILAVENNRQNCSPAYVSRDVFGWESARKKDTGLNGNKLPMSLKFPKYILNPDLIC